MSIAAGVELAILMTAEASSDLKIITPPGQPLDCQGHPRKIAIQNQGDSAQDLTGWKLESDKPGEVFDLGVAGTLGAGKTVYVYNGHNAPLTPLPVGDEWIYGWNPNDDYDPSDFVLWEDGQDFIQIVDPGGNVVSKKPCPIPPATPTSPPGDQPQPTQQPSDSNTGSGSDTTGTSQTDTTQTQGVSQTGADQGSSTQSVQSSVGAPGATGEVFGPPAAGEEAPLPESGGRPLAEPSLPLAQMGVLAGMALVLLGALAMRLAVQRPGQDG